MAERIEGLSISLGLDSIGIDKGLSEVKRKLSVVNNEMKANMSAFDRGERSVNKYETQLTGLNKKLDAQKIAVRNAKDEYERMVKIHGEGSEKADKAAADYNKEAASLNNLSRYVEKVTDELKAFEEEQRIAASGWTKFGESLEATGSKLTSIGDGMKDVGKKMSMYITAPVVGFGALATKTGMDFDDSMAKVQAISGATGEELSQLRDKAKEMGATTKFSASESADALNYMALAGWSTADMLSGIDGVMALAAASGEDLATVSDIVTDSLSAFGLKAEDSAAFSDVLAAASANANTDVRGLGAAFQYVAPVAGALGYNVEDTATAIGLMSNAGIKGEKAGTALRTMMTNLAKPTKAMQDEMDNLGISLTNTDGTMKTFDEIMGDLRGSFSGLDEAQQASAAATIFGKEAMSGALSIINTSEADYDKLSEAINGSEGSAKRMADIMEGTLGGAMREIKSGLEGFAISIYETLRPALEAGAERIKDMVTWLNSLSPQAKLAGVVIAGIAAAIGPVLVAVGSLISMFGGVMTALAPLSLKIAKAGGLFKYLRVALAAFTGPVGITIAVLTGLGIIFTTLYQKSETFRNAVQAVGGKIKEFAGQVKTAFGAVTAVFQGNGVKAGALMRSLGLSEDQIKMVFVTFVQLRSKVQESLSAITGFFSSALSKIKGFWSTEGAQITAAAQNIFNGLKNGAQFLGRVLKATFEGIFAVIKFIMPAVLAVIKMVWGNIKGVITGALDVILGAVKIFSGLFTGDFSKMWEGVKQVFFGAIRLVWNAIQLTFFGKIAKGAALFVGSFRAVFVKLWQYLIGLFTRSVSSVFSTVARYFNLVLSTTRSIFNAFSTFLRNIFTAVRDSVTRSAGNIFTNVRSAWTKLKNSTTEIFRGIYNGIKTRFTDIVNAAKALPKRIGDGIGSMASKVKGGVTKVINNLATTLGKGINGVITGVNWVLDKIGVGKAGKIDLWTVPQYAQGTKGHHPGGPMVVGDGKGSNAGPELIETPDGKQMLSPAKPTLMNGPKGTKVWSATATRDILDMIPHYAFGDKVRAAGEWAKDNLLDPALSGVKAVGGKVKDVALNVFDYLKNPGGLLDLALETLGIKKPDGGSMVGDMARGGFNKVKNSALGFIKGKLTDFGSSQSGITLTGGNGGGFGSPFRFTSGPGPRNTGIPGASTFHKGWDWAAPVGTPIPSVTDGIGYRTGFHRLSGNFVEVKSGNKIHRYQHNSKNLLKVGQPVKKGQKIALVGATGVGSGPHLHYEVRGLETGGITNKEQLVNISEKNREEITIPMHKSRRTDAMKLMAIAGKKLMSGGKSGGGITRPNQLPNVAGGGSNEEQGILKSLLAATLKQNEILMQLLQKNGDVYLDNGALVGGIGDDMNTHLGNSSKNSMYMNGVR